MLNRRSFFARVAALPLIGILARPAKATPRTPKVKPRPATPGRYTPDEIAFMRAMERFKRASGRGRPTWNEGIDVLNALGYPTPA